MLSHVSVGVADVERAAKFYDAVLGTLGYARIVEYLPYAIAYGDKAPSFWIQLPNDQQTPTVGNGSHIGFAARSRLAVDAFHHAAVANGGADNGAPGPRPDYGPDYYGAFVIDLDGNRIEATLHSEPEPAKPARKPRAVKAKTRAKKAVRAKAKPATRKAAKKKAAKRPAKRAKAKRR